MYTCSIIGSSSFCLLQGGGVVRSTQEFFTHLETSSLPVKGCKFDLRVMAIEQWVFFSVTLLFLHATSVYNGHFRVPVTLTSTYCLFPLLRSVEAGFRIFNPYACGANALIDCATAAGGSRGETNNITVTISLGLNVIIQVPWYILFCVYTIGCVMVSGSKLGQSGIPGLLV